MAGKFSIEAVFRAIDRVSAPVSKMQNRVGKFTRKMSRGFRSANRSLDKLVGSLKTAGVRALTVTSLAITGLTAATLGFISAASKIEDATAAFTPLLGGAKRAEELVAKLNDTAASTPFQVETLSKAAGQLLPVMNGDIENTIKTLRMMGDTAGGNAQKLESITRGFTKAMLKGKVDMESLNMIAEAGVPIFTELAESMGTEVNAAFFKMISAGKVATTDLTKAFEKMTSSGGVFFEGMVIASRTQSGLWSTLKDNISLTAAAIGQQILPISKQYTAEAIKIASRMREWVNGNKELIKQRLGEAIAFIKDHMSDFLKVGRGVVTIIAAIVAASLTMKTAMLATAIVTKGWAVGMFALKGVMLGFKVAMGVATAAQWLFNVALTANPIGAIILAVTALIGLGVLLVKNWDSIVAKITESAAIITGVLASITSPFKDIFEGAGSIVSAISGLFGGGRKDEGTRESGLFGGSAAPEVVSPQARTARTIEESRQTSTAEVTIKDETGRAEMTGGKQLSGIDLVMLETGAF